MYLLEHINRAQVHKAGLHLTLNAAIYHGLRRVVSNVYPHKVSQSIVVTDMKINKEVFRHTWEWQRLADMWFKQQSR